ncbi:MULTISPECIES: hypothetical protein [unclassified Paracoccus (in: a-proteobacteria)]|uniref:hypothetical protein n=1 Tax=unclassified Paracoccus (in: a-proteobacteria) TaxID=2688777 RepID=UPI001E3BCAFF|nr:MULTISPECIES: hypothetical protein [unclassified Paracoccus (in: a-proteobacteria)]UXU74304.1 hypothetical protein GB879_010370 [Paracoccus sp. SMMA_5]UXU80194.1 hypothetical protein GB880_010345 [Paracoccus sp. SMMA_5_TC]
MTQIYGHYHQALARQVRRRLIPLAACLTLATALAGGAGMAQDSPAAGGITASAGQPAPFDIVHARVSSEGRIVTFRMAVSGQAGESRPAPTGALAGSQVFAYVWPTTLDSALVGFEPKAGILAMVATAHPDFDDTPLYDENRDGDRGNDGDLWHSHWVVLGPDDACGPGALKVIDIPEGASPSLPATWPGLPLLLDSPGWQPVLSGETVEIAVAFDDIAATEGMGFDAVTAGLRVNANVHAPLLCVSDIFKIASGDLSLPGRINQ